MIQALRKFALLHQPIEPKYLKEQVEQLTEKNPIMAMMPIRIVDSEGRNKSESTKPCEGKWVRQKILEIEVFCRQTATFEIQYARFIIRSEHAIHGDHFHILADHSYFIPAGKHGLVASGLENFFCGNYVAAQHILVPQLEISLRYILEQAGTNTSTIQADMTQELLTLSQILNKDNEYRMKLENIFGEAWVFEMDNVFNYKGGPSLRHSLSHGLLSENEFHGPDAIYACWFIYRFYFLSLIDNWEQIRKHLERIH